MVEPMGPSTRQFIQLGFGFMISNPEVRGPSGLSTTRPQAGENNGLKRSFSGGTPKHVISPLNIAKKILDDLAPPFKTTQQFESSELLNEKVTEHVRLFFGV